MVLLSTLPVILVVPSPEIALFIVPPITLNVPSLSTVPEILLKLDVNMPLFAISTFPVIVPDVLSRFPPLATDTA